MGMRSTAEKADFALELRDAFDLARPLPSSTPPGIAFKDVPS
jgi:hypothetical protein